ncbi:MAG: right-handed parallel beta-helix repeat-containing protein [Firmicutes bacterium]|nr:right-handed parallel beta-helix repeat-containing protein [Bacillota bacterium]
MKKLVPLLFPLILTVFLFAGCIQQPRERTTPGVNPESTSSSPQSAPLPSSNVTSAPSDEPPDSGDWMISGQRSVEGKSITLQGNLIIGKGSALTLQDATLLINSGFDGQYKISVEPGGSLYVYGSTITPANPEHRFAFIAAGSAFEMKNSELHGVGWGPDAELWDEKAILSGSKGLVVTTNGAIIEGNLLSNNYAGIILAGSEITLSKNEIHSNKVHGIFIYEGENSRITGNSIRHETVSSPFRIVRGQANRIADNTIVSSLTRGVIETFRSHENTFENNNISGLGVGIELMFVSNGNLVKNNTISVNELGVMVWGWNNRVENNTISGTVEKPLTGIYTVYAYNTLIVQNTISDVGNLNGIMMWHSSNNEVINNQVSASTNVKLSSGLMLYSSSKENMIQGNSFLNFPIGISIFFSSDNNTINNNEVTSRSESVFIQGSSGNTLYDNNFSGKPPRDDGTNRWDYQGKGNYWNKYGRVGNTSNSFKPPVVDNYPLAKPVEIARSAVPKLEPLQITEVSSVDILGKSGEDIVIENQTIQLRNLVVGPRQTLTLRNVTLITGGSKDSSKILARGGKLSIYDSRIIQMEYGNGCEIRADDGATFVMKNTEVNQCGHEWKAGGIQILTDNAILRDNILINTMVWFSPYQPLSGGRIEGNTILNSFWPVILSNKGAKDFSVRDNTIRGSIYEALYLEGQNHKVMGNTISDVAFGDGIFYKGNNGTIEENKLSKVRWNGIVVRGNNNSITNNVVTDSGGSSISVEGENNKVSGNK